MTEDIKNINILAAYMEESMLYGAGMEQNILFQYDIKKREIYRLGSFRGFKDTCTYKIRAMYKYKEMLFCFSLNSYEVATYHLKENKIAYFYSDIYLKDNAYICCTCRIDNNIWIFENFPSTSIVIFSMENMQFSKYQIKLDSGIEWKNLVTIVSESCVNLDGQVWKCIPGTNSILKIETKTMKTEVLKLNVKDAFYSISYEDGFFYILGIDGKHITVFNKDTNEIKLWSTEYKGHIDKPFREALRIEDRLFLIPRLEDKIFYYNIQDEKLHFVGKIEYPTEFKRIGNWTMFSSYKLINRDKLYLFPYSGNGILCLNIKKLEFDFHCLQVSEEEYIEGQLQARLPVEEGQIRLEEFLKYMKLYTMGLDHCSKDMHLIGKKGWGMINREC